MTQRDTRGGADWWSGFEHDPRVRPNFELRAADRDRDLVRQLLTEAFADGRLDRAEFDERSDRVGASRTLGDLPPLVTDLVRVPHGSVEPSSSSGVLTPARIEERAVARWEKERRDAAWTMLSVSLICWVIWAVTSGLGFPWPLFVMLGTGLNLARVQFQRSEHIAEERARLERKQAKQLRRRQDDESP